MRQIKQAGFLPACRIPKDKILSYNTEMGNKNDYIIAYSIVFLKINKQNNKFRFS